MHRDMLQSGRRFALHVLVAIAGAILTCGKDHVLKMVDSRTFQVRKEMRAQGFAVGNVWCSADLSADERHVAAGSTDGTVFIWEVCFSHPYRASVVPGMYVSGCRLTE